MLMDDILSELFEEEINDDLDIVNMAKMVKR